MQEKCPRPKGSMVGQSGGESRALRPYGNRKLTDGEGEGNESRPLPVAEAATCQFRASQAAHRVSHQKPMLEPLHCDTGIVHLRDIGLDEIEVLISQKQAGEQVVDLR